MASGFAWFRNYSTPLPLITAVYTYFAGSGSTPLHYAACGGNAQCCQVCFYFPLEDNYTFATENILFNQIGYQHIEVPFLFNFFVVCFSC